ncbi:MAG: phosphate ABC transporter permease subunit PstC, partial [Actinomycetota bacterium]
MNTEASPAAIAAETDLRRRSHPVEALIQGLLFVAGALSILTTIGIVVELGREAWLFFGNPDVSIGQFLTGTEWQPSTGRFGILPLVLATV